MKRLNEGSVENTSKRLRKENEDNRALHIKEYGFSTGGSFSNMVRTPHMYTALDVIFITTEGTTEKRIICNVIPNFSRTAIEKWILSSIDLKKHWCDKTTRLDSNKRKLVNFNSQPFQKEVEYGTAYFFYDYYSLPDTEIYWYISSGEELHYWDGKPDGNGPVDGVRLRDLKVDRKLPIQNLFCYLAVLFDVSGDILDSLFWTNFNAKDDLSIFMSNTEEPENPEHRLVWNYWVS